MMSCPCTSHVNAHGPFGIEQKPAQIDQFHNKKRPNYGQFEHFGELDGMLLQNTRLPSQCGSVFERVASALSSARTTFLNCIPHLPGHRSLIMIEPQGPLNAEMRENRIRQGDKRIADKLDREFTFAQVQQAQAAVSRPSPLFSCRPASPLS